jgi:hypothetical protein
MNTITVPEFERMRVTAAESFFDACKLGSATAANWGDDPGVDTFSYANEIACGFKYEPKGEIKDGSHAPLFDAVLRLPVDTDVTNVDRVQMTGRHGEALDPVEYYAVEGKPSRGPSALVLNLKLITGASAL